MTTKFAESTAVPVPVSDDDDTTPLATEPAHRRPPQAPTLAPSAEEDDHITDVQWPPGGHDRE